MKNALEKKIHDGERISEKEALTLFSWDLKDLGKAADFRRSLAVPGKEVGFIIDRIINFTNICEAACAFCAFHARADIIRPYEMTTDDILEKVRELSEMGGLQVMLQGGLHPGLGLEHYVEMVRAVKARFPDIRLHSFSPAEIAHIAKKSAMPIPDVVKTLKEAGLDSIPGASDILVARVRKKVSPKKISVEKWREVMRALSENGMKSSATMTYGMGETLAEKIEHLAVIRDIQDETGVIRCFIPWSFSPPKTRMASIRPATGFEYLQVAAISRIFLDNIAHMQAGWLTEGLKPAQMALAMGADDMGGVLTEETVVKATGVHAQTSAGQMIALIRNAGKIPVLRDSDYRVVKRYG
ncbi:Cyclic dehypoxanthine futalosine synthase [Candidatus Desulfarcum epimagneticum]|uniref:Cyclic dehypoxanthine futalosine synthase n=1 Tax=uncultured Desulfobacteraceae bacterium TaxID=218296 RepID=A0A484HG58_9BACT|nr:Cyclic dehypoxanthine futalosine synthase [uncultured Desulfobacteraceae bacterium]